MTCTRGWTWCVKEWTHDDDGPVKTHHGEDLVIGDGLDVAGDRVGLQVRLTQLDDELEPLVLINDAALTLAQAMKLGGHLIGLANEVVVAPR